MYSKGGSVVHRLLFVVVSLSCMCIYQSITCGAVAVPIVLKGKCIETEKQALLEFKQGLFDAYNLLSSWGGPEDNCCQWHGVTCHNVTGNVIKLHLPPCQVSYDDTVDDHYCYSGQMGDSLLKLQYLSHLDLSGWNFFTTIPKYLGSLSNLRYLNLSRVYYPSNTVIPVELSNLSSLHTLDLGGDHFHNLQSSKLGWLSRAHSLRHLDLSNVDLSRATDWLETIAMLPSLFTLQMSNCYLPPPNPLPLSHVNISKSLTFLDLSSLNFLDSTYLPWLPNITRMFFLWIGNISPSLNHIDLSGNKLSGSLLPEMFWETTSLRYLDLSCNLLEGHIPNQLGNSTSLEYLGLTTNSFEGGIPMSLGRLCNLQTMDLSNNKLNGQLEVAIHNITTGWCPKVKMATLQLDDNHFEGIVPQLRMFPNLRELNLNNNNLTSIAPDFLQAPLSLQELHLGGNMFDSNYSSVMQRIGQLSNLRSLEISFHASNSVIVQPQLNNLPALQVLSISNVPLNISLDWVPPFQLQELKMDSCHIGPHFPLWLQNQSNLAYLNLSHNGISGAIPGWFWNIFNYSSLTALDISRNYLSGTLFNTTPFNLDVISEISFSSNNLSGPIPPHFLSAEFLDLSSNFLSGSINVVCTNHSEKMSFLNLANNFFSEKLPNCWSHLKSLQFLNLASNNFSGEIPESMGYMPRLYALHLRKNNFSGELPLSFRNLTANLVFLDVMENNLSGIIPEWIGESLNMVVLSMQSNKLHGNIPPSICNMNRIHILDLSFNHLSGGIPQCFDNFTIMSSDGRLQTYDNEIFWATPNNIDISVDFWDSESELIELKGIEREYINKIGLIKLIDLSSNKLTGEIPKQLTHLVYLKSLNLSRNHLSGAIPSTIGNLSALETLDLSRNQLSGGIPSGLSVLYQLSNLNLSCNNLSGTIPTGYQLQTFDSSSYQGNIGLCGFPLAACSRDGALLELRKSDSQPDNELLGLPFYIAATLGFILGFWGVFGSLVIKRSWRIAYFRWLSGVKDDFCVKIALVMPWLQRRFQ